MLHQDNGIGVLIFATDVELQILANCRTIYVDGTFRTAPAPYSQMFTIHGEYMDRVVLLVVAFLTGKTQPHYDTVFNIIMREIRRVTGNNFTNITLVIADFEIAVFNVAQLYIPNVQIGGCYVHFIRNLWKHVQFNGLTVPYRNDVNLKECIRLCFALGFVPLAHVRRVFTQLVGHPNTVVLLARYPALQIFFDYVLDTYINGQFPPDTWNVYLRGMSVRANNFVESYFGRWNQNVGVRHPSLWTVIRKLKDEQAAARNAVARAQQGYPGLARRRKWVRVEARINNLKRLLVNGQRTVEQYWNAVSYTVYDPV